MIVHTLKMCTGDAGPEQSLVLFILEWTVIDRWGIEDINPMQTNPRHHKEEPQNTNSHKTSGRQ